MSESITLRIGETGSRQVAAGFRRIEGSLKRMGTAATRFAGAAGGLGVAFGGKAILSFTDAMGRLQADAGLSTAAAKKLRDEILGASRAFNLSKDQISAGAQRLQDYQGVLPKMIGHLGKVAKIAKATGANMSDLAGITGPLLNDLKMSPTGAIDALAKLSEQARFGAVRMKDAARVLPKLLGYGAGLGLTGAKGVQQMGTLLQVAGVASGGSAEEALTGSKALLRDIQKGARGKGGGILGRMGIKIRDQAGNILDPTQIMAEILKKTGGKMGGKRGLNAIFSEESLATALVFKNAFNQKTGKFGGAVATAQAAGKRGGAKTIDEQLKLLTTGIAADAEKIHRALNDLEIAFQKTGKSILAWGAQNPYKAAGAAVGGYAMLKSIRPLVGWLLKGKGKGAAGALAGAAGATPVFVVNMPGSGIPGAGAGRGLISKAGALAAGGAGLAGGAAMMVGAHAAGTKYLMATQQGARARAAAHEKDVVRARLIDQASALAKLGAAGVGSYGAAGSKQALNQENVLATLKASAQKQGDASAFNALLPVLRQLTATLAKGPTVTVKAPGIDSPTVAAGRKR